jgi:hypothetical protein
MKILWLVSFRPLKNSSINDFYQSLFVDSVKCLNEDITFSITQFEEENVELFIKKKKLKSFFKNIPKTNLPNGKKYSNKIMLKYALDQCYDNDFDYLVYSTADIVVPNSLFKHVSNIKDENFCALIYPNTHITNGKVKSTFWPYYGIDLIIFKISKSKLLKFKEIIEHYNQFDWGVNENFYISVCEKLNLKIFNLFKKINVLKFENDFQAFKENRSWQIRSWKENQKYFLNFLEKNNLSKLYAYGSYYYLLFKIFNFRDISFKLALSYMIFYPYNFIKKIHNLIINLYKKICKKF